MAFSKFMDNLNLTNALCFLIILYVIYALSVVIYNLSWHPLSNFPGPAIRAAFDFPNARSTLRGTGFTDIKALHDRYGSVVRLAPNVLSYNSAQAWKDIYGLKANRTELPKDPNYYRRWPAVNLLNATQHEHSRIRKLLAPGFSDSALLEQEPLLNKHFDLLIQKLKEESTSLNERQINLMAWYNFVTFDIIGDLVLGESFGALADGKYHPWIRNVFEAIKFLGVIRFGATYPIIGVAFGAMQFLVPSFAAKRKAHLAYTKNKIDTRLSRKKERRDIIASVLEYNSKTEHAPLSHLEILGNSRILLTAGSETTATHLCGATWLLLKHPKDLKRVQSEIRTAFGKSTDITLRRVSDEGLLPYLNAVIKETFRMYPSIPAILPRMTGPNGAIIDGRFVAGGISLGVHQWSSCRSASNFTDPDLFQPARWLEKERPVQFDNDERQSLQPFALGPRGCLGRSLALFEIRSILVRMLWHFDLSLDLNSEEWINQKEYTFWDKPALWVKLKSKTK